MRAILITLAVCFAAPAIAGQTTIPNYETTRKDFFYTKLYSKGGFTLYCGQWFGVRVHSGQVKEKSPGLNIEHVYPASWMLPKFNCTSRTQCRQDSPAFNFAEADMHNLYPAISFVNSNRSNEKFADVPGETLAYEDCDFESSGSPQVTEPRPQARGNVARAIFYMHHTYGFPVPTEMQALLKQWHAADPVSEREKWRNMKIHELQGTTNSFIDDPALADTLFTN